MISLPVHETLSGIFGSISLTAWIFVLVRCNPCWLFLHHVANNYCQVPQLVENYRLGSAEGISLTFLTVWFVGDLANLSGSIWAGLVPTVIVLAIYFCVADAILITQCLYYLYINSRKPKSGHITCQADDPSQPLLVQGSSDFGIPGSRRRSSVSQKRRNLCLTASTLPPTPEREIYARAWITNALSVAGVCAIGVVGWTVAWQVSLWQPSFDSDGPGVAQREIGAEILGYISAALYLG